MNRENVQKVLVAVESERLMKFYMPAVVELDDNSDEEPNLNWCNTSGCIAGHAFLLEKMEEGMAREDVFKKYLLDGYPYAAMRTAAEYMGLDRDTSKELFCPDEDHLDSLAEIDKWAAATQLRHLLETGELRPWREILEEQEARCGD